MVSSAHPLASAIGVEIMKNGGNAIDAAIATHFALAVVYPQAGNIGGGGFAVIRLNDGTINSLDFREKAPALAHRDMYLNADGQLIDLRVPTGIWLVVFLVLLMVCLPFIKNMVHSPWLN